MEGMQTTIDQQIITPKIPPPPKEIKAGDWAIQLNFVESHESPIVKIIKVVNGIVHHMHRGNDHELKCEGTYNFRYITEKQATQPPKPKKLKLFSRVKLDISSPHINQAHGMYGTLIEIVEKATDIYYYVMWDNGESYNYTRLDLIPLSLKNLHFHTKTRRIDMIE